MCMFGIDKVSVFKRYITFVLYLKISLYMILFCLVFSLDIQSNLYIKTLKGTWKCAVALYTQVTFNYLALQLFDFVRTRNASCPLNLIWYVRFYYNYMHYSSIKVITKLPNSEQSYKGKVQTHNYINRQNQSTTGKLWKP